VAATITANIHNYWVHDNNLHTIFVYVLNKIFKMKGSLEYEHRSEEMESVKRKAKLLITCS